MTEQTSQDTAPFGLLGRKLGHSWSPQIHARLGSVPYELHELEPEELAGFVRGGSWRGLNVTIPYKREAAQLADEVSERVLRLGVANTLVHRPDGTIYADNSDVLGFAWMLERFCERHLGGSAPEALGARKCLVLGSGGASQAIRAALEDAGARVVTISRTGGETYETLAERHADAALMVNTTPVGMYPNTAAAPVDLRRFPRCQGVLDLIYNPARTALMQQAEALKIPNMGGLFMLAEQARCAASVFTGKAVPAIKAEEAWKTLGSRKENRILIGMPGCGKSTVGKALADLLDRPFVDCDREMEKVIGMSVADYITRYGEEAFRAEETAMLTQLGKTSGLVIATGGGCVTRPENYPRLHQNGTMIFLERELSKLPKKGRPLSLRGSLQDMYTIRLPMYRRFADVTVPNDGAPEKVAKAVEEAYERISDQRA